MKNMPCVNSIIEIALEQIQHDIAANLQCQNHGKFTLCVSRHLDSKPYFGANFHTNEMTDAKISTTAYTTAYIR